MSFNPAHDAIVWFSSAADPIDDTLVPASYTNGTPTLPTTTGAILGYCDLPEGARGLNNAKGFAIGMQGAAYNKRGRREPTVSVKIRPGNMAALGKLFPPESGRYAPLTLFVQVKGEYVDVYRGCKPASVAINFGGGEGQGGELSIDVKFQAISLETVYDAELPFPSAGTVRGLSTPLMWHDVRSLTIKDTNYRRALMGLTATLDIGLERKNERPNWGDHVALSRTAYELLEHHKTVTGELTLHERMPPELFTEEATSQDWHDLVVVCSSTPSVTSGGKGFTLTLSGVMPQNETMQGGESSKEINFTVPFAADDISYAPEGA